MDSQERRPYEQQQQQQPPFPSRAASTLALGTVGFLSRTFLYIFSNTEVKGLEKFLELVDSRQDVADRTRGLITVSNHLSVYVSFFSPFLSKFLI